MFEGAKINKGYVLKASAAAIVFWLAHFIYEYYAVGFDTAIVRSFALAGATLISLSLLIGPLSLLTRFNFLVHRRTVGVWGFTFILMHFLSVLALYYNFDLFGNLVTLILFGLVSLIVFIPAYLTSNDTMLKKLGFRKWKFIHRLCYIAYILAVVHYTLLGSISAPKIILFAVTLAAIVLQLAGFAKTLTRTKSLKDALIGIMIIVFGAVVLFLTLSGRLK